FGGGKSVIIGDPAKKSPEVFQAFGRFVDGFKGRYIAAKDMNITSADLKEVKKTTRHVLGIEGEPGSSGDPSPVTARGIYRAMEVQGDRRLREQPARDARGRTAAPRARHPLRARLRRELRRHHQHFRRARRLQSGGRVQEGRRDLRYDEGNLQARAHRAKAAV